MRHTINPLLIDLAHVDRGPETGPFYIIEDDVHPCFDDTTYKGQSLGRHREYWKFIVSQLFGSLNSENPTLYQNLLLAYTGAPRGRVAITGVDELANTTEWTVFVPFELMDDTKIIELVRKWYRLPNEKYVVDTDPHDEESKDTDKVLFEKSLSLSKDAIRAIVPPRDVLFIRDVYNHLKNKQK